MEKANAASPQSRPQNIPLDILHQRSEETSGHLTMKTADLGVLSNQAAGTNTPGSAREANTGAIPSSRAF